MKKIELLAPAGDLERLKIAVRYGADAVYLGGKQFSLRSRASNFDLKEIREGVEFANQYGAKVHVTVNIVPHDEDLEGIETYLKQLEEIGVTAVIVASVSIMEIAKKVAPKLEVHVSTQQSSTNSAAVAFYEQLGVDRVVLARECSMDQIKKIVKNSKVDIEAFIHGGMCVNYSGRCTLSNWMTLRDANRGGCAQSCRWKYHVYQADEIISDSECLFSMSSKDLLAVQYVEQMIRAGVASLKIEGRMKSAYYIATVVKTYRMLIDECLNSPGGLSKERIDYYSREFIKAENRPTGTGFLGGLPDENLHLYGINGAGVTHDFLAYILDYDESSQQMKIEVRNRFEVGNCVEVFGPDVNNRRFLVEKLYDRDGNEVIVANKPTEILYCPIPFQVHAHDMIRRGDSDGNSI